MNVKFPHIVVNQWSLIWLILSRHVHTHKTTRQKAKGIISLTAVASSGESRFKKLSMTQWEHQASPQTSLCDHMSVQPQQIGTKREDWQPANKTKKKTEGKEAKRQQCPVRQPDLKLDANEEISLASTSNAGSARNNVITGMHWQAPTVPPPTGLSLSAGGDLHHFISSSAFPATLSFPPQRILRRQIPQRRVWP